MRNTGVFVALCLFVIVQFCHASPMNSGTTNKSSDSMSGKSGMKNDAVSKNDSPESEHSSAQEETAFKKPMGKIEHDKHDSESSESVEDESDMDIGGKDGAGKGNASGHSSMGKSNSDSSEQYKGSKAMKEMFHQFSTT